MTVQSEYRDFMINLYKVVEKEKKSWEDALEDIKRECEFINVKIGQWQIAGRGDLVIRESAMLHQREQVKSQIEGAIRNLDLLMSEIDQRA